MNASSGTLSGSCSLPRHPGRTPLVHGPYSVPSFMSTGTSLPFLRRYPMEALQSKQNIPSRSEAAPVPSSPQGPPFSLRRRASPAGFVGPPWPFDPPRAVVVVVVPVKAFVAVAVHVGDAP
jgi:hypothetical protein